MKLLLSALAVLVVCAFEIDSAPITDKRKLNCMIKHLKTVDMLDEKYPNFPGGTLDNCREYLESFSEEVYEEVMKPKKAKEVKECVLKYLKKHKFADYMMKNAVTEASLSYSPRHKSYMKKKILEEEHDLLVKGFSLCFIHKKFSEAFDEVVNSPPDAADEAENPESYYCARKHVVENKEINVKDYNITMNPQNINTATANCEFFYGAYQIIIEQVTEDAVVAHSNSETLRTCVRHKLYELKYVDQFLILEVLSEIKLTDAQKAAEKKRFLERNDLIFKSVYECV